MIEKNWYDAKTYCEDDGEYIATFETLESINWLIHTIHATPGNHNCFYFYLIFLVIDDCFTVIW